VAPVRLAQVTKVYPTGHAGLRQLDLAVLDGEFMVLVGPSGSGKSTALRLVAGLETPTSGQILIGSRDVTQVAPQDRDVAMVFQSYALYPHLSVRENLGFGLRMRGVSREVRQSRVGQTARMLDLVPVLDRKPAQLSGGQRQRVALGRALVREPQVFLLDEPLSNLDAKLRVETRAELGRLHQRLGTTVIYVTHDQEEAMTLGTRVAVLRDGTLQQVAPPLELYQRPATRFVAGFIGTPEMNFLPARGLDSGQAAIGPVQLARPAGPQAALTLGIRPRDLKVVDLDAGDVNGQIELVQHLGGEVLLHLRVAALGGEVALRSVTPPDSRLTSGTAVGLRFDRHSLHWFDPATGLRLQGVSNDRGSG
jgi:multiple sugar transport system ATP-binding protein